MSIEVLRSQVTHEVQRAIHHALTRPPINEHESVTRAVMCAEISGARTLIFHIGCEAAAQRGGRCQGARPEPYFWRDLPAISGTERRTAKA